jgi:3-phosphoglycerate kinase
MNIDNFKSDTVVLIRVDFNISNFNELFRIESAKDTIKLAMSKGSKVILCTHYGRPKNNEKEFSTINLVESITKIMGIGPIFVDQFDSFEDAKTLIQNSENKLFLLENSRFNINEFAVDENLKLELAKDYSQLADYFIDEAFSVSHRKESTNYYIKQLIPSQIGINYIKEIDNLNKLKEPNAPFLLLMGGAKVDTKLGVIKRLLPRVDRLLLGGMICFTFLKAKEIITNQKSLLMDSYVDVESLEEVVELLKKYENKIILPLDFVYNYLDGKTVIGDIGSLSAKMFCNELEKAKTIFFNGTMGEVENPSFALSTNTIVDHLVELDDSLLIAGGGDTESFLNNEQKLKFDFVSTGGGACLEYIANVL